MTPLLTATPSSPPSYNPGMAETFSWIPIQGANRPLFAQATYLTNASDISINAGNLSLDLTETNNRIDTTNTRLNIANTKIDSLTSIQTQKQNEIITLLHGITGTALEVDLNTDQLELHVDGVETLLHDLTASVKMVPGFSIPAYDQIDFEYVGTTDIFRKVTYLKNSTQVMALSFVYVTEPPSVGNAIIQTVKKI
jgi:hypothetical protein